MQIINQRGDIVINTNMFAMIKLDDTSIVARNDICSYVTLGKYDTRKIAENEYRRLVMHLISCNDKNHCMARSDGTLQHICCTLKKGE